MKAMPQLLNLETDTPEDPSRILRLGKDEMNLAEFPITLLTDRVPKGQTTIVYQDQIFDEKSSKPITRKLTISADGAYGLPTAVDDDVILALIQLTKETNGFTYREVSFYRSDLLRLLNWSDAGFSYKRLAESLRRWLGVTLVYENAWRDNRHGTWTTKGFHILDNIELVDGRTTGDQGSLFLSKIIWNKAIFESFEANYLKSIDYGLYLKLQHPTAKRMYRFLSKRMYRRPELTFDLRDLAFEHIGLSRSYSGNVAKVKEKLQPALEELEQAGFLQPLSRDERYQKDGKVWKIRLVQNPPTLAALPEALALSETASSPLVAALVERGVTESIAAGLVERFPDRVEPQMEAFDWQVQRKAKTIGRNPPGYLVKAITENFALPAAAGFVTKAEQKQRDAAKQARERKAAETRRIEREEEAAKQAERQAIDAYWASLTPKQQAELDAASTAQADPEILKAENGPLRSMGQQLRRDAYIRQLLAKRRTRTGKEQPFPAP